MLETAAQNLRDNIVAFETFVASLPINNTDAGFVRKGFEQIKATYGKFLISSQLRGGRSSKSFSTVSLRELYDQVTPLVSPVAQTKGVTIQLQNDIQMETQNRNLSALVLHNILDNAIAYSPNGGNIEVAGNVQDNELSIVVTDHGNGIPLEKFNVLFQPFSKVEGMETYNHEGMGFSLYLDKLIMTYLGGGIALQSKVGKGTKASFSWPITTRT
jgi:signal transduction histidine kinase